MESLSSVSSVPNFLINVENSIKNFPLFFPADLIKSGPLICMIFELMFVCIKIASFGDSLYVEQF